MSDFKAKYQALQILQRLASGEKLAGKGRGPGLSPRKPGVRNSDDILKEKYTELAELVALQHLEKQAVSALQNMYVSPPKGERRSRRRKRDGEARRRERREEGLMKDDSKKQRPLSASSSSSHSSTKSNSSSASFASKTSSMSNSSRSSSMSHASRASSGSTSSRASCMSNASRSSSSSNSSRTSSKSDASRSSTRSNSSSNSKPVERHFVTIVEEEEEEEIINQDVIEERQIAKFDEELAQENAEEARREKEASKRTRRVSFVLETQEESSEDEDNVQEKDEFVLEDEDPLESRREKSHSRQQEEDEVYIDAADPTPRYIEIENSLLREILSPRSPRRKLKLSPRSDEKSPTRDRSKSPKRKHRSPSPRRAWEVPLPPRPVKDAKPCDHKLSNTDNPEIRKWLRHKNALIRRERKAEVKKEREERRAAESASQKRVDRLAESGEYYDTWVKQKAKDIRRLNRSERRIAKEEKRRQEEEKAKREELFRERQRQSVASFGEVPSPRRNKIKRSRSAKASGEESNSNLKKRNEKEKEKNRAEKRTFPSSNPLKGLTYDEWMRQKMASDQANRKKERQKQKSVPDPENIIPDLAKERIERAKSGKGKRVNTGLQKEKDERPECDRTSSDKPAKQRPYTWTNNDTSSSNQKQPQGNSGTQGRAGLQRPSTAKNHIRNASHQRSATSSSSVKGQLRGGFSPSSARPEPQGSESNDDHSEHGVKLPKGKKWHGNTEGNDDNKTNKNHNRDGIWDKALVKRSEVRQGGDTEDSSIFLTEFDG